MEHPVKKTRESIVPPDVTKISIPVAFTKLLPLFLDEFAVSYQYGFLQQIRDKLIIFISLHPSRSYPTGITEINSGGNA